MLVADEEATSEVRLGRAREPRDAGKENPFTWLGCPVVTPTMRLYLPRVGARLRGITAL